MNAKGAALIVDPHPRGHIVYPYTDEILVGQAACLFASAGIRNGEAVILIMTRAHCEPILRRIEAGGLNVTALQDAGQLTCRVAEDLLGSFTIDGALDEEGFRTAVRDIINRARASIGDGQKADVRIFGEMVSLLWRRNEIETARRIEELWNEVIETHSVSLMCTYSLSGTTDRPLPQSLIDLHSGDLRHPDA